LKAGRKDEMDYREHDCGLITANNSKYSSHENQQRTKHLQAKIEVSKYNFITLFQNENKKFFVVDSNDTEKLEYDLKTWSDYYEQSEIKFIPKGKFGIDDSFSYIEINEIELHKDKIGNYYKVANIMGKWAMKTIAESDWKDINI